MPAIRQWKSRLAEANRGTQHRVVSSDDEMLILVDESDRIVGHLQKGACHEGDGVLHRAFSLFVFNPAGELLLQRRSEEKRLWPLYWSNSCCSHPRQGETIDEAVGRRLQQELGLVCDLRFLYKFEYVARFDDVGSEHEVCSVYAGVTDDQPQPNPYEIADIRWLAPARLDEEMEAEAGVFTPWFELEWPRVRDSYRSTLGI